MPVMTALKCPNGEHHAIPFTPPMSLGYLAAIRKLMDLPPLGMLTWLTIRDQEGHTPDTTAAAWAERVGQTASGEAS